MHTRCADSKGRLHEGTPLPQSRHSCPLSRSASPRPLICWAHRGDRRPRSRSAIAVGRAHGTALTGQAAPYDRPHPRRHDDRVRGAGGGDGHARRRGRPRGSPTVRARVQRVHGGKPGRRSLCRAGGRPSRTVYVVRRRVGALRRWPCFGRPRPVDGDPRRGALRAGAGLRHDRHPCLRWHHTRLRRGAATTHVRGAFIRLGDSGDARSGTRRRCRRSPYVASRVPRSPAAAAAGRPPDASGDAPPGAAERRGARWPAQPLATLGCAGHRGGPRPRGLDSERGDDNRSVGGDWVRRRRIGAEGAAPCRNVHGGARLACRRRCPGHHQRGVLWNRSVSAARADRRPRSVTDYRRPDTYGGHAKLDSRCLDTSPARASMVTPLGGGRRDSLRRFRYRHRRVGDGKRSACHGGRHRLGRRRPRNGACLLRRLTHDSVRGARRTDWICLLVSSSRKRPRHRRWCGDCGRDSGCR